MITTDIVEGADAEHQADLRDQRGAEQGIGRAGGDEFICIFEDGGRFTASDYAIRVKQLCQDFNNQSDKPYYVDISIGYHCFLGKDYKGIRNIIRKADDRLNHAKAFRRKSAIKAYAAGDKNDIFSYLENSAEILRLYVPQMQHIETEDDYIKTLIGNYIRIRSIAKDNMEIMERVYLPMINSRRDISRDEIGIIRRFSTGLHDAYAITSLDGWLAYHQAKRIYEEAVEEDDDNLLVWALDELVTTSYGMMCMAGKLYPISEIYERYHKVGLEAAEKLLGFLEPEKFIRLPEELKKQVLINSRYIRVVSEVEGVPAESKQMETLIERMKKALALSKCSFYRKNVPTYDWKLHEFRTLEYISTLTDFNNENNVRKEDIAFINESSKLLKKMYEGADGLYRKSHITGELGVSCNRNEYLAGELSIRDYKDRLAEIVVSNHSNDDRQKLELSTLQAIAEYHLVLNEDNIDDEDRKNLRYFYQVLVDTIQQTTGSGRLVFIGPPLIHILKNFVELTESMSFKDIGLTLLATVHPPSYAHSLTVADLSVCIAKKLIGKQPEVFIGMPGCRSQEDVCRHGQEILEYVYNAALTHDFGKLFVLETILTYGRNLSDEEFEFIKLHPLAGSNILSLHKSTSRYANVAKGHHKWYDNNHGYPKEFDIDSSEYKPVIYIVSCADSLDAATDEIGRSYKKSLTLEDVIQEIEADRGSRYAPYVVDLLSEESVVEELRGILKNNRAENYKKVYRRIRNSDTKYKQEGLLPRVAMKE